MPSANGYGQSFGRPMSMPTSMGATMGTSPVATPSGWPGSSGYGNAHSVSSARMSRPESRPEYVTKQHGSHTHSDVLGMLHKTLTEKDAEIAHLRDTAQMTVAKYEQQLAEVRSLVVAKSKHIVSLEGDVANLKRTLAQVQSGGMPRVKGPLKQVALSSPGSVVKSNVPKIAEEKLNLVGQPSQPLVPYKCVARDDQVDGSLECWYNQTSSEIDFKRINRGVYMFGSTQVEIDVINHKLMARTEDGWNRGKYAPIEKFLATYEPIEISRRARRGVRTN